MCLCVVVMPCICICPTLIKCELLVAIQVERESEQLILITIKGITRFDHTCVNACTAVTRTNSKIIEVEINN